MSDVLYSACPACSIVLAKFRAARLVNEAIRDLRIRQTLDAPDHALHFGLWTLWIFRDINIPEGNPGSNFLHMVLLPFHEAGHYAIFRWFGEFIMIPGGTLGLQKARLSDAVYAGMDQER